MVGEGGCRKDRRQAGRHAVRDGMAMPETNGIKDSE